jgi:hypothetical protein
VTSGTLGHDEVSLDQAIGRLAAAAGPHALRQGQLGSAAAGQPNTRPRDALAAFADNQPPRLPRAATLYRQPASTAKKQLEGVM